MNGKVVFITLVIFSLLFVSPYVSSFAFGDVNYDLGNILGYIVYDFRMITGLAGVGLGGDCPCMVDEPSETQVDSCYSGDNSYYEGYYCTDNGDDTCEFAKDLDECPVCGDESIDGSENCDDGSNNGEYGYCNDDCSALGPNCGDGTCDAGEETCSGCVVDCEDFQADCSINEICAVVMGSGGLCVADESSLCGDNMIEGDEVCDGSDLNSETCQTKGFDSGTLSCSNDCSTFDTSDCTDEETSDSQDTDDDDDDDEVIVPTTCAEVNGVCSDSCVNGFDYYNDPAFDSKCVQRYGENLVCCIPTYISSTEELESESSEDGESQKSVKSVEDYMVDKETVRTSPAIQGMDGGLSKILMSPSYAMGGIWIIFALIFIVVGISFYMHKMLFRKK
ncbi:hypothetical protein HON86_00665 [Candidatus Woesearchaeota archaeon]|nr:hypothetical protein [Candidatus Woesearchaeota archaeon]MBT7170082.1 hypothetical protein [Candidatus Woesearchaeota archaeon]